MKEARTKLTGRKSVGWQQLLLCSAELVNVPVTSQYQELLKGAPHNPLECVCAGGED